MEGHAISFVSLLGIYACTKIFRYMAWKFSLEPLKGKQRYSIILFVVSMLRRKNAWCRVFSDSISTTKSIIAIHVVNYPKKLVLTPTKRQIPTFVSYKIASYARKFSRGRFRRSERNSLAYSEMILNGSHLSLKTLSSFRFTKTDPFRVVGILSDAR